MGLSLTPSLWGQKKLLPVLGNMTILVFSYILISRPRKSFSISCRQTQTFDHTSLFRSLQFNEPILCTATFTSSRYGDDFCISPHVHCVFCQNFYQSAVHVLLSRFYPDFIQILSLFYPDFIQIY